MENNKNDMLERFTDEELMDALIYRGYSVNKDKLLEDLLNEDSDSNSEISSNNSENDDDQLSEISENSSLENDDKFSVTILEKSDLLVMLPENVVEAYWDEYCEVLNDAYNVYKQSFENIIISITRELKLANNC